jgi:choline dehydrogenase-like flavoprotein
MWSTGPPTVHSRAGWVHEDAYNPEHTWQFQTEPSEGTAGRLIATTQGRKLGGSSSINGMIYNRGAPISTIGHSAAIVAGAMWMCCRVSYAPSGASVSAMTASAS